MSRRTPLAPKTNRGLSAIQPPRRQQTAPGAENRRVGSTARKDAPAAGQTPSTPAADSRPAGRPSSRPTGRQPATTAAQPASQPASQPEPESTQPDEDLSQDEELSDSDDDQAATGKKRKRKTTRKMKFAAYELTLRQAYMQLT